MESMGSKKSACYQLDESKLHGDGWLDAWSHSTKTSSMESLRKLYFGDINPESIGSIILYHGACSLLLEKILKEGLKPRSETGISNWIPGMDSRPDLIYLATKNTAISLGDAPHRGLPEAPCKLILVEVEVDTKNLVPDEDSGRSTWYESLYECWSCAHKGEIPLERIRRVIERPRRSPYEEKTVYRCQQENS